MHSADKIFRDADPAARRAVMSEAESEALLERIVAAPVSRRAPRPRRRSVALLGAAAFTAVTVLVGIGLVDGPGRQPAFAATPEPLRLAQDTGVRAAEVLGDLAARVEKLPAPQVPHGAAVYFEREMWSLNSRIDGELVTSRVVPQHYDILVGADGSRKQTVEEDGSRRTSTTSEPEYSASVPEAAGASAAAMKEWVLSSGDGSSAGAFFDRYPEKVLDTFLAPAQRAGALRALASFGGVEYNGRVTDRSGRDGEAFSVESDFGGLPGKQTLIIDPDSGELLGYEDMLTTDPGKLNVKVPAVTQYITFLKSEYVREK